MSGYELTRFFDSTARWVWTAPQSQIYLLLRQLQADGLIEGSDNIRGEKLKRTTYSLTPQGYLSLTGWLSEDHDEPNLRDPLLLQVLYFDMVDPGTATAVLRSHIETLEQSVEKWDVHRVRLLAKDTPLLQERLRRRPPEDHDRIATLKAHVFGYMVESARLRILWAQQAIEIVNSKKS